MDINKNSLCKAERLNSKNTIEELFSGGAKSFLAYPIRVVFMPVERKEEAPVSILVSVSKKRFKRAVKRNRVKRQIREAYRKNKHALLQLMQTKEYGLAIAFIYLENELRDTAEVEYKVKELLVRVIEKTV